MGGLQYILVSFYNKLCIHPCWDLLNRRVYCEVLHHLWCGLSACVRREMLAKCSHHNLIRWFSCSSVPRVVLCNSETLTPRFPWPACVTSTFVHVPHTAHSPVKHDGWTRMETGVSQAVSHCAACGLKAGECKKWLQKKAITLDLSETSIKLAMRNNEIKYAATLTHTHK